MMLCVNCPKKPMAFARVWGCMLLLLIAVLLSFQPLITLDLGNSGIVTQMEDLTESFGELDPEMQTEIDDMLGSLPEQVDISAMDIVSCVVMGVDFISALSSEDEASFDQLAAKLEEEEGRRSLMVTFAVLATIMEPLDIKGVAESLVKDVIKEEIGKEFDNLKEDYQEELGYEISEEEFLARIEEQGLQSILDQYGIDPEEYGLNVELVENAIIEAKDEEAAQKAEADLAENIFMMILNILVVMICLLAVLGMTVIAPVIYIISALSALIPALIHVTDPDYCAAKVSRKLMGLITLPISLILYQCVLPSMHYASGTTSLLIISLVCVLFNTVLSRLHSYTAPQMKYANVMQGVSLVGVIGYLVFFSNVIKAGVFNTFINGKLGAQLMNVMEATLEEKTVVSNGYVIDIIMIVVTLVLVLSSTDYLKSCLQRLSCSITVGKKGSKVKDVLLVRAIFMLPIYILPTVVASSMNFFEDVTKAGEGDASLLVLSADSQAALDGVLAGIIIILVAEIALIVLKATLCRDVSRQDMGDVMCGVACADDAEEAVAEEAAPAVEEAVAADAPAAEETAEDTEA